MKVRERGIDNRHSQNTRPCAELLMLLLHEMGI